MHTPDNCTWPHCPPTHMWGEQAAEAQCEADCRENQLSEAETKEEIAIILVQLAFLLHVTGDEASAGQIYTGVLNDKPADKTVLAVANNNFVSLRGADDKDMFDSYKRVKMALNTDAKLTARQREVSAADATAGSAPLIPRRSAGLEARHWTLSSLDTS